MATAETTPSAEAARAANPGALGFLRQVYEEWSEHRLLAQGAALAYYAIFSMAPLLVLVIAVAGLVFGRAAVQGEIVGQLQGLIGPDAARMIEEMIQRVSTPSGSIIATAVSLGTMLLGASGVVGQLQVTLNDVFGRADDIVGMRGLAQRRLSAFGMILGIALLLLISMVVTAVVATTVQLLSEQMPLVATIVPLVNFVISLLIASALFGSILKILPDKRPSWRDAWVGGIITALLFTIGKTLIGMYLGRTGATSVYGAAGSLVLVLLWVYYSSQILLIGAVITAVNAHRGGRPPQVEV
jgi:membrane protein